jgi:ABC-type dipeptide/oligopeptide/nickel transport system permease component
LTNIFNAAVRFVFGWVFGVLWVLRLLRWRWFWYRCFFLVVVMLGVTGVSDRILKAYVDDELRTVRQSLSQRIKDPVELEKALEQVRLELMQSYGLDRPWYERIPSMVLRVLMLDLGYSRTITSFAGSRRVVDIIAERIPYSVMLVTTAVAISAAAGIWLGMRAAYRRGSLFDRSLSYLAAVSYALPSWWTGLLLILFFYFYLRLFPAGGLYSTPPPTDPFMKTLDLLWHAALPCRNTRHSNRRRLGLCLEDYGPQHSPGGFCAGSEGKRAAGEPDKEEVHPKARRTPHSDKHSLRNRWLNRRRHINRDSLQLARDGQALLRGYICLRRRTCSSPNFHLHTDICCGEVCNRGVDSVLDPRVRL